jgi:hypothetical protein
MFASNLVSSIVGLVLSIGFMAILVGWLKAIPLGIIMLIIAAMLAYDVFKTLRTERAADRE